MPTLFGSIMGAMGSPDPIDQMEAYADAQRDKNRAAVDPNNPTAGPPAANATGAATTMPPGQVPNSAKSDPSMGHMIAELARRQQSEQMFNQSLGMGFGAFAQPRDREAVDRMFNVAPLDATKIGASIMAANSDQQGQDRSNVLGSMINDPVKGAQIAAALHMPGANPAEQLAALKAAYAANPQSVGAMITQTQQPTPDMANLEQITNFQNHYKTAHPDATQSELESIARAITAKVAGPQAEQMVSDARAFREKFGHDPTWKDNPDAYKSYIAQQGARTDALGIRATSEDKVNDLESKVDAIKNDKALPGLMKRLVPGQGILSLVGYNDAERALLQKIKQATSDEYVRGLADPGLGTRKTQQEMQYVGQSLGGVLNASNLNVDDYKAGLGRLTDQLYRTHADIYGQSGSFKGLDPKYHGYINDVYRKGGALSEGVEDPPDRMPLDDDAKKFWNDNKDKQPRSALIEHLRNLNYDTSGLK